MKRAQGTALFLAGLTLMTGGCAESPVGVELRGAPVQELEVRYLANEGFMIEGSGNRVLVDALIGEQIIGYNALPDELRRPLEQGTGEWGDVDIAIASHHHADHFDPNSVIRFLAANREAVFVSTPQAIERVHRSLGEAASHDPELLVRLRAVLPKEGEVERLEIRGVEIEFLNLHHGPLTPPVENLGIIVSLDGMRFLHFGDTEAKMETFGPYLDLLLDTDLALLPFWFLSSEWRADMVRDLIRPRWIVVGHLPTPTAPAGHFARWGTYENLVDIIEAGFPEARFPDAPGERYRYRR